MRIRITNLIEIQEEVNKKVREKLDRDIQSDDFMLAFNVELFEFFNAIGTWKWWKHSHNLDKEKILDELADCFAFFLSIVIVENNASILRDEGEIIEAVERDLNDIFRNLESNMEENDISDATIINDLMLYVGTDNEVQGVLTVERFAIAIFIISLLFKDLEWKDLVDAYKKKSSVNIKRQEEDY